MHPLHEYLAQKLANRLSSRKVVVWYDERTEFERFIGELRGDIRTSSDPTPVSLAGTTAHLAEYTGSLFELRALVEPLVSGDVIQSVIVYVPGLAPKPETSVLLELECASRVDGSLFGQPLKAVARNVLRQRYTDGVVDELLAPDRVFYDDIARASSESTAREPPSTLQNVFQETGKTVDLLARWLMTDVQDGEIEWRDAKGELIKLVRSYLGLELPADATLAKLRASTQRYVLGGELATHLRGPLPPSLAHAQLPTTNEQIEAVRHLARKLRLNGDAYRDVANQVEKALGLDSVEVAPEHLGAIDTFAFEEVALLKHCGQLIVQRRWAEAAGLIAGRSNSYWLDRDTERKAQWEAARLMIELGRLARTVREALGKAPSEPRGWIEAYAARDGWHRLDQAQRRLEAWVANLQEDPDEIPLGVVRREYEETCHAMAEGFTRALVAARWTTRLPLHQTRIQTTVVGRQPKPVAVFLVDAMRFEMGVELSERLPRTAEVSVSPAMGSLPSITPVGMAALQPGASASFNVIEQNGKLGAQIDGVFLPDLQARRKLAQSRIPELVDVTLDELLGLQPSKLAKKVDGAQVIFVRSQEIDHAGETGFTFQARQVMDTVIDNIARAIRKLSTAGVEHSVVTADHGHLFFPDDRPESMRTDAPGGQTIELHRRCWIGRGGMNPPGTVRVAATSLGYASDLEFVFPAGAGVFKSGGDLAFHHGGPSLQEVVVPVVTCRFKAARTSRQVGSSIEVSGLPEAITNRMITLSVTSLFGGQVAPGLFHKGRKVGRLFGVVGSTEVDLALGTVRIEPKTQTTIGLLLTDESVKEAHVVILDAATDAEVYRSPKEIPVRLGV